MSINTHLITNVTELIKLVIFGAEGDPLLKPDDVGDYTVTYGYGYTFIRKNGSGEWKILGELSQELTAIGVTLTSAENSLLNTIEKALNANNKSLASQKITELGQIWSHPDLTEPQAMQLYTYEINRKSKEVLSQFKKHLGASKGNALYQSLQSTREMAALLCLAYNAPGLIGQKLTKALWNEDRAEAWYQIRYDGYKSSGVEMPGLVKRRFLESELFGLYTDPTSVGLAEAKQVYQMLQKHRPEIIRKERDYGQGSTKDMVAQARSDYDDVKPYIDDEDINYLGQNLKRAWDSLFRWLKTTYPNIKGTADSYKPIVRPDCAVRTDFT